MVMEIEVRILIPEDVTPDYVAWFDDAEVMKFSENRFGKFSLEGQRVYISEKLESKNEFLFGVFATGRHIGNVMLGPVDQNHGHSEITYMLGERDYWGQGVMSRAIAYVLEQAFREHNLVKVYAGTYENNIGSVKVLEKCGFELEGRRKNHFLHDGRRVDMLEFGCFAK